MFWHPIPANKWRSINDQVLACIWGSLVLPEIFCVPTMRPTDKSVTCVGYLSVLEEDIGQIGGLLLLNVQARPVEFHCTAPVKPSRAQQVLYGVTLQAYVIEQIAATLIAKTKLSPTFIATDRREVWLSQTESSIPTIFVPATDTVSDSEQIRSYGSSRTSGVGFDVAGVEVFVATERSADKSLVTDFWSEHGQGLEFCEPFDRIREALAEAHGNQGGKKRVA